MNEILNDNGNFLKEYEHNDVFSPTAYDLIEKLLRFDVERRIGCRDQGVVEIKEHPFFSEIDWTLLERKAVEAPFKPKI